MGIYTGIKGLIFDLDGTLVDTAPQIRDLCNGVMADLGAPPVNTALVMSMLDGKFLRQNGKLQLL